MADPQVEKETGPQAHEKEVTVFVNTRPYPVASKELSFEQVVALAFPSAPYGPNTAYTVRYQKGEHGKSGTLVEGQSVKVKDGMRFDVTATDKS